MADSNSHIDKIKEYIAFLCVFTFFLAILHSSFSLFIFPLMEFVHEITVASRTYFRNCAVESPDSLSEVDFTRMFDTVILATFARIINVAARLSFTDLLAKILLLFASKNVKLRPKMPKYLNFASIQF